MRDELQQLNQRIEQRHWWFVARREILVRVVRCLLAPGPDAVVVDIGCGTGTTLAALGSGYRCLGVDTSSEAVRRASLHYPQLELRAIQRWADAADLFGRARLVLLNDVLEHIENDADCFGELVASVGPDTFLVITVPAGPELWSPHDEMHGHYRRYTMQGLQQLWSGQPVRERLLCSLNWRLYLLAKLVRGYSRRTGRAPGPLNTDLLIPPAPVNWLLKCVFAGEAKRVLAAIEGRALPKAKRGVSLLAILQRTADPDLAESLYGRESYQGRGNE